MNTLQQAAKFLIPAALSGLLLACGGSSSGGNESPNANAGPDIRARFGAEVTLSGRDSYDNDGPILEFNWTQVSGPTVELAQVNSSTVKFTVPNGTEATDLTFELAVEDNGGKVGTDRVTVSAVGPIDLNRFLTYFSAPDDYVVEVALDDTVGALTADVSFDLVMTVTQRYQTQDGTVTTRTLASETRSGTWTAAQQANDTFPRFGFDIPQARIEDLVDVNKSTRNNIDLIVSLQLENVGAALDYVIQVLNNEGEPIAENTIAPVTPLGLNAPTPDGISVDVSLMLDNLGFDLAESKTTALAYYAAIDPDNEKTTLSDWLVANNYNADTATRAKYLNGFDLAFGRDMRMWSNDQGHVFAFVENYPNVDSLVDGSNHFGTVAMEYSPGPGGGDPFTKFYTFIRDPLTGVQQRVVSMDFDGRGEKFTPGNCTVCHGGTPAALVAGEYPDEGNIGAGFLLWDVDTFAFSDAAYEGRTPFDDENFLNKSDYEAAFKTFNDMVKLTNITDAQRELVHGWYGGESMPNNTFDGSYVPVAWRSPADGGPETNPDNASEFYLEVFGPTCRACHNGLDNEELQFASYAAFIDKRNEIIQRVFNEGTMPMARITMDNFWVGTQAEISGSSSTRAELLAEHLSVDIETQQPGAPEAIIASQAVNEMTTVFPDSREQILAPAERGDRIELSALDSLFANTYNWSLTLPDNSSATLSSTSQASTSFATDIHGDFVATLTIANAAGTEDQVSYTYRVANNIPVADDLEDAIKEDEPSVIDVISSSPDLGDGDASDHRVAQISNVVGGAVAEADGVITFVPSGSGLGGYDYVIEDIDGDLSNTGQVAITVTALPDASNDATNALVGTASDAREITINALSNDTLGVEPTEVLSPVRIGGSLSNGLNSCGGVQGSMSFNSTSGLFEYTPPVACAGSETYQYTIRDDNQDESTATITISVNRSSSGAFSNVDTAIANNSCQSGGCHDDAHIMDLNGTSLARWQDITECNRNAPDQASDCDLGDRINLGNPGNSLILRKPLTDGVTHDGGTLFTGTSDADYLRILRWIEEGAAQP